MSRQALVGLEDSHTHSSMLLDCRIEMAISSKGSKAVWVLVTACVRVPFFFGTFEFFKISASLHPPLPAHTNAATQFCLRRIYPMLGRPAGV